MVANHPTRPRWVTPDSDRRITQLMGATGTKCTGCGFEATNRKSLKKLKKTKNTTGEGAHVSLR